MSNTIICYARLNLAVDISGLQREIKRVLEKEAWMPHYNRSHYTGDWSVLPLRAPGGVHTNPFAELMGHNAFEDTLLMDELPSVRRLLDQLKCEKLSARLLNLKANIKPHRDAELAFENGEARLHIPVFTHEQVEFYVEEQKINMAAGDCWYINANLLHSVANKGTADRIHLVIDCKVNNWLSGVFEQAEKTCMGKKTDRARQLLMIESLRMQNSAHASALADKLERELNNE